MPELEQLGLEEEITFPNKHSLDKSAITDLSKTIHESLSLNLKEKWIPQDFLEVKDFLNNGGAFRIDYNENADFCLRDYFCQQDGEIFAKTVFVRNGEECSFDNEKEVSSEYFKTIINKFLSFQNGSFYKI